MASRGRKHLRCPDAISLAEALAEKCDQPHRSHDGWMVCCPAHEDATPSLHITPADEKVLLKCFAGCTAEAVMAALDLDVGDLFVHHEAERIRRLVKVYDYVDAAGTVLHQKLRYEPKSFTQRRPDPAHQGQYIARVSDIERVLYHLPAVITAIAQQNTIYLVEGEKSADALEALGYVATCSPDGAGKWSSGYSEMLRGAHVVLLPDYDAQGAKHAALVAAALPGIVATIKIVTDFHTATPKSDIADWLAAGGTREEFDAIVDTAPFHEAQPNQAPVGFSQQGPHTASPATQAPTRRDAVKATPWYQEEIEPYVNKRDIVDANNTTICAFLRHHDAWQGKLWWDDMANKPMIETDELSDYLITKIGAIFGKQHRLPIKTDRILARCLSACCYEKRHDPLQHYLDTLSGWDGTPRLEHWLIDCAGVVNTAYHRFLSRILIVSMIARAYEPGCLYRNVIVLEGPEEFRKSSFVAALVPDKRWHLSLTSSFENKDVPMLIQGIWVAELNELDSLSRTEETRLKSFITETEDPYVPKWALFRVAPKRRTIFVGTTNESNWLKSTSGNTRFWPVRIFHPMDVEQFIADREQLYAEAKLWYHDHRQDWWATPPDVQTQAAEEREERRQASVYEADLALWLDTGRFQLAQQSAEITPVPHETTWAEIATGFLRHDTRDKWKDINAQKQVTQALKSLGWHQKIVKRGGKSLRIWSDEPTTPF